MSQPEIVNPITGMREEPTVEREILRDIFAAAPVAMVWTRCPVCGSTYRDMWDNRAVVDCHACQGNAQRANQVRTVLALQIKQIEREADLYERNPDRPTTRRRQVLIQRVKKIHPYVLGSSVLTKRVEALLVQLPTQETAAAEAREIEFERQAQLLAERMAGYAAQKGTV